MCPNCRCPDCKAIMVGNGNPAQKNYICKNCGKQLRVPKKREVKKVEEFYSKRQRSDTSETAGSQKAFKGEVSKYATLKNFFL